MLRDIYRTLKGQQITLNVWVELMPIVGPIERVKLFLNEHNV